MTRTRASAKRSRVEEDSLEVVKERLKTHSFPSTLLKAIAPKLAAVLVPLFTGSNGEVRVLLTRRSSRLSTHQGEVCLPGGRRDPEDPDDVAAALREANEELGLDSSQVEVLGCLQPFLSKHYLSVTPVPAVVPSTRQQHAPHPNPAEVEEVFDVPLSLFLGSSGHSSRDITWESHEYRIHYFDYDGFTIWGLTASILIKVAKLAFSRDPEYQEHAIKGSEYTRFWYDGQKLCVHTDAKDSITDNNSTIPPAATPASPAAPDHDTTLSNTQEAHAHVSAASAGSLQDTSLREGKDVSGVLDVGQRDLDDEHVDVQVPLAGPVCPSAL